MSTILTEPKTSIIKDHYSRLGLNINRLIIGDRMPRYLSQINKFSIRGDYVGNIGFFDFTSTKRLLPTKRSIFQESREHKVLLIPYLGIEPIHRNKGFMTFGLDYLERIAKDNDHDTMMIEDIIEDWLYRWAEKNDYRTGLYNRHAIKYF